MIELLPLKATPAISVKEAEPENLIGAKNDQEALILFLNRAGSRSSETRRRYEREIVRFTIFLYQELNINYQEVRLKHIQSYLHFIQNLPKRWTVPGILPGRSEKIFFQQAISSGKSTDQVINVLSAFFSFLDKNRYIRGNPVLSAARSGEKIAKGTHTIRYFYEKEWSHIKDCLKNLPDHSNTEKREKSRTQYLLNLSYGLALRESELTHHSCNDICYDDESGFYFSILGKGRKRRNVPLNDALQEEILFFKKKFGLISLTGDRFPLAPKIRSSSNKVEPMSSRGLRFWWKSFMNTCADKADDKLMSDKLYSMPFHAVRHTALTHLARVMDIEDLAIFAGHDSINTTAQYYHVEAKRLSNLTKNHVL
ncbi:Tyrosine recombinase XerC [invertebrate metagenome]|uniref:Tyrosine recombinase XerC n=1 Tax=invertebrate metagenome TaxID=1711999 RepID=A0A2H9T3H5_9ZZZZ